MGQARDEEPSDPSLVRHHRKEVGEGEDASLQVHVVVAPFSIVLKLEEGRVLRFGGSPGLEGPEVGREVAGGG